MNRARRRSVTERATPNLLLLLICFSFVNLQFLPMWREIVYRDESSAYFLPALTATSVLGTLIAYVLASVLVFAVVSVLAAARSSLMARVGAVVLVISLLNPLTMNGYPLYERAQLVSLYALLVDWGAGLVLSVCILGVLLIGALAWWKYRTVLGAFRITLLVLAPFAALHLVYAGWALIQSQSVTPETVERVATSDSSARPPGLRVVWLVFDELDQRAVFEQPPARLRIPALRGLYREAFVATAVEQAGTDTVYAVPGMTVGRPVDVATPAGARELRLELAGLESPVGWTRSANLFDDAARRGANIGVVGWYHPYCRLFAALLNTCTQLYLGTVQIREPEGLVQATLARLKAVDPLYRRRNAVAAHGLARQHAIALANDPRLDLVYVHIPLPHRPAIFDDEKGTFTPYNLSIDGYFDNVAAADRFLAAVRDAMQSSGLWNRSAILLTADHAWRGVSEIQGVAADSRIPFVLRFPEHGAPSEYPRPYSATNMRAIVLALLDGEIRSARELRTWLEGRAR